MAFGANFRSFLLSFPAIHQPIRQVAQQRVPQEYSLENGFVWFSVRSSLNQRVLNPIELDGDNIPVKQVPDEVFLDVEVFHPDINVTEKTTNLIHGLDTYSGAFGDARIGLMLVDGQSDDYVSRVETDDSIELSSSFLSVEIRLYQEQ